MYNLAGLSFLDEQIMTMGVDDDGQILTGVVPYHDKHDVVVSAMKLKGEDPHISTTFPPLLSNLMKRCWDKNYYARPTTRDIIAAVQNR